MRKRFETLAAAAAMAEGGCEDTALAMRRELEALKARGRQKIVIALGPAATPRQAACIEHLLGRFPADVLLMALGDVPRSVLTALQSAIAKGHFLTVLQLKQDDKAQLSTVMRALHNIQFTICAGSAAPWCAKNSPFPVFTV